MDGMPVERYTSGMESRIRLQLVSFFLAATALCAIVAQYAQQYFAASPLHSPIAAAPQQCTETQASQPRVLFVSCGGYF
jgi:hypothetical protein